MDEIEFFFSLIFLLDDDDDAGYLLCACLKIVQIQFHL